MKENNIIPMLQFLAGDTKADPASVEYAACAERYLKDGGLTDKELQTLRERLTQK